jgi:hypothetical protein
MASEKFLKELAHYMVNHRGDPCKLISKYIDIDKIKGIIMANKIANKESLDEPVASITGTYEGITAVIKFYDVYGVTIRVELCICYSPTIKEMKFLTFPNEIDMTDVTKIDLNCYYGLEFCRNNNMNNLFQRQSKFILYKSSGESHTYLWRGFFIPFACYDQLKEWLENYSTHDRKHKDLLKELH